MWINKSDTVHKFCFVFYTISNIYVDKDLDSYRLLGRYKVLNYDFILYFI